MDDDDETVVGSCLHCNSPPPPRTSSRSMVRSTEICTPCNPSDKSASRLSTNLSPADRVQVSCDDCRSWICDGELLDCRPLQTHDVCENSYRDRALPLVLMFCVDHVLQSLKRSNPAFFLSNIQDAIGAMSSRPTTRLESATAATHFTAGIATRWTSVRTVAKWCVIPALP